MSFFTPPLNPEQYRRLLEKLLANGEGMGKRDEVVVIPLLSDPSKLYVTTDIQNGLRHLKLGLDPSGDPAFKLEKKTTILSAYKPADPSSPDEGRMTPDPGAYRVMMKMDEEVTIPVMWDTNNGFRISAGSYIAVLQKDVIELYEALDRIRHGLVTPEDALYKTGLNGERVTKFDVYGIDGGSINHLGYKPVDLWRETSAVSAHFREVAGIADVKAPFTRRMHSNFVADHAAPERATFKKRERPVTPT